MESTSSSEQRDFSQIHLLKALYCAAVDDFPAHGPDAADRLRTIFAEDAQGDYGLGPLDGVEAILAFLDHWVGTGMDSLWHAVHTPLVRVDGDRATGQWTMIVRLKLTGTGHYQILYGRYFDQFRRTPEGWRICGLRFQEQA